MLARGDAELLCAWDGGDEEAGNALLERHFSRVSRFFRDKVPDAALEDMVQRTFLGCLEARSRFRADGSFRAFVLGIARRQLLLFIRERHRHGDPRNTTLRDLGPSPSSIFGRHEQEQRLLLALRSLPVDLQVALELSYWEELSIAELAEVLEVPEGTAKSRLFRARRLLRDALESGGGDPT
jgi:RNA polymerase sigma-70 factor (ECF subfamily)